MPKHRLPSTTEAPRKSARLAARLAAREPTSAIHFAPNISSKARYSYTPLDEDKREIRVLTVLPGHFDAHVHVRLSRLSFDDAPYGRHAYEAISYTWGSSDNPLNIYVQQGQRLRSIAVTRNCETALRYLRYDDVSRDVWVDAICIDQEDLSERARQVQLMPFIYARASRVVSWIGPASENSELAMQWIDDLGRAIAYDYESLQFSRLEIDTPRSNAGKLLANGAKLEALANLLERSYFDRLWVWQEVQSGDPNVILKCGKNETLFRRFMTIVHWCSQKVEISAEGRLSSRLQFLRTIPYGERYGPNEALNNLRQCRCQDDRDRIYTSLAFGNACDIQITPNYKIPVRDVYASFVLAWLTKTSKLDFLGFLGDDKPREGSAGVRGLPSWVPDWSKESIATPLWGGYCSGLSAASVTTANGSHLGLKGVAISRVRKVSRFSRDLSTRISKAAFHQMMAKAWRSFSSEIEHEIRLSPISRVLVNNRYSMDRNAIPNVSRCEEYLLHIMESPNAIDYERWPDHLLHSLSHCLGRSLFLTHSGQVGLGPHDTREGDLVAALLGHELLTVLRPCVNTNSEHYQVIGSASCTGYMDGEAFLGPMPEQYEVVRITRFNMLATWHKTSGRTLWEDPRLPPLPPEWTNINEGQRRLPFWKNQRTGQERRYGCDPRLEADALESRGVKLQDFCLV